MFGFLLPSLAFAIFNCIKGLMVEYSAVNERMVVIICTLVATVSLTLVKASYESQQGYEYKKEKEIEGSPGGDESREDTERSLQEFKEIIKDGIEVE